MKLGILHFAEVNLTMPHKACGQLRALQIEFCLVRCAIHVEHKTKRTNRSTQDKSIIQSNHQNPQTPNATHNSPETMCKF